MANEGGGRTYYDSLERAIAGWGKWAGESGRGTEARQAFDMMIALRGEPSGSASVVRPYFMPPSGKYISVTWDGVVEFQLQSGLMKAAEQLTSAWYPEVLKARHSKWFVYAFPNHRKARPRI